MKDLSTPHEMSPLARMDVAIECAFNALIAEARKLELHVAPVMGLMYLPTQSVTQQFKVACREVLRDLDA